MAKLKAFEPEEAKANRKASSLNQTNYCDPVCGIA
jgi:hypothetical protein